MDSEIKEHISSTTTWGRALFMVLFGIIYSVAEIVLVTVAVLQFCFVLFTASTNARLLHFGAELSDFLYQIFLYLTYNKEEKPFPFANWPTREDEDLTALEQADDDDDDEPEQGSTKSSNPDV